MKGKPEMKIKALFNHADTAEYAKTRIMSRFADAKCEVYSAARTDGLYSYSGVIPMSIPGSNFLTNIFCPVFPENTTLDDIENRRGATVIVICKKENIGEITRILISQGGKIDE